MHSTLIVARMAGDDAPAVAEMFGKSDATELPDLLGVRERVLFRFHGLYFHLLRSEAPLGSGLEAIRQHPLFVEVNERLAEHITPYSPLWRSPRDAMAEPFYHWRAGDSTVQPAPAER
uniref:Cyclase n=1 Tax=uncultured bacterium BAC-AB1442/1414/561 TaxID=1562172 RepID=A0A0C4S576_9BACT|nr:cyclase [uncultured bacterium BAC-AB1442/1414/561]